MSLSIRNIMVLPDEHLLFINHYTLPVYVQALGLVLTIHVFKSRLCPLITTPDLYIQILGLRC